MVNNGGVFRRVEKVWKSQPTIEGAGVHLRRAFGNQHAPKLDPFLLLDDFHSADPKDYKPGFPWHPHRGIETISYVLDGQVEHGDSMGNGGVITPGDVQWMTAGSGIVHQEMPKGDAKGQMWGFQLWANLPAKHKMMDPRYREVKQAQIPIVKTPQGATVRVISGEVDGTKGPVQEIVTEPEFLDVSLSPGRSFTRVVKPGHTVFAYVIDGKGFFDIGYDPYAREAPSPNYFDVAREGGAEPNTLVVYGPGDTVVVATEKDPVRFFLVSGKPIREPVAWYGPVVMNTQ